MLSKGKKRIFLFIETERTKAQFQQEHRGLNKHYLTFADAQKYFVQLQNRKYTSVLLEYSMNPT